MKRQFAVLAALLTFFSTGCGIFKSNNYRSQGVGDVAYDFTLPDQNGKKVTLSDVLKKYEGAVIAFYLKDESRN